MGRRLMGVNGHWAVGRCLWAHEDGQWALGNGQVSMDNGLGGGGEMGSGDRGACMGNRFRDATLTCSVKSGTLVPAYSQGNEQCHSRLRVLVDGIPSRQARCESPMPSHGSAAVCGKPFGFCIRASCCALVCVCLRLPMKCPKQSQKGT